MLQGYLYDIVPDELEFAMDLAVVEVVHEFQPRPVDIFKL